MRKLGVRFLSEPYPAFKKESIALFFEFFGIFLTSCQIFGGQIPESSDIENRLVQISLMESKYDVSALIWATELFRKSP